MKEVQKNIYCLDVAFTDHSLKGISPYLILGEERNLLIDTALNTDECELQLMAQMAELGAAPENTDVYITHMHVDHCGLIARLKTGRNVVYAGERDKVYIDGYQQEPEQWGWLEENIRWTGTPADMAVELKDHVAVKYCPHPGIPVTPLPLGAELIYGGYTFKVVNLAGHTAAHTGLWCEQQGILFSGDHLMAQQHPNITTWNLTEDFVRYYKENLVSLMAMPVRFLYPAHGEWIGDVNGRAREYLDLMGKKIARVSEILSGAGRPLSAWMVARQMQSPEKFDCLPPLTRWFICSDILAYLQHLKFQDQVLAEADKETLFFRCKHAALNPVVDLKI